MAVHHVFFVLCIDIPVVLIHFASKDALRWRLDVLEFDSLCKIPKIRWLKELSLANLFIDDRCAESISMA